MARVRVGRALVALACVVVALAGAHVRAGAALPQAKKTVLVRYLDALRAGDFAGAFAQLTAQERRYFATPANYASIFSADRWKLESYRVLGSITRSGATIAYVSERVRFYDFRHDVTGSVTARIPYGIIASANGYGIKDPYHPWRAIAPDGWRASAGGLSVAVRKVSLFTGRVELFMTFENRGDAVITILPYGRSVLHDDAGRSYQPIATKLAGLTDANLYTGVRLAPSGRYTGFLTFLTPDRFTPKTVTLTLAPLLADGADAPFSLDLPAYALH